MTIQYVNLTIEPYENSPAQHLDLHIRMVFNGKKYDAWQAVHIDALRSHFDLIMDSLINQLEDLLKEEWPIIRETTIPETITPLEKEE